MHINGTCVAAIKCLHHTYLDNEVNGVISKVMVENLQTFWFMICIGCERGACKVLKTVVGSVIDIECLVVVVAVSP